MKISGPKMDEAENLYHITRNSVWLIQIT